MGNMSSREERRKLDIEIERMKLEGPFSVYGLFDVNVGTITSLISLCLTYLIVLLQFN
jgi:hypothetical protein